MWRNVCLDRQSEGGIQMILRPFLVLALQVLDICEAEKLLLVVQDKEREWNEFFFSQVPHPSPPPRSALSTLTSITWQDLLLCKWSKTRAREHLPKRLSIVMLCIQWFHVCPRIYTLPSCYLVVHVHVVLTDIQNFFHKVLAVIFAKDQHPYIRRSIQQALSPFSSWAFNVCRSYVHFLRLNRNVKALCLYCTDS